MKAYDENQKLERKIIELQQLQKPHKEVKGWLEQSIRDMCQPGRPLHIALEDNRVIVITPEKITIEALESF